LGKKTSIKIRKKKKEGNITGGRGRVIGVNLLCAVEWSGGGDDIYEKKNSSCSKGDSIRGKGEFLFPA